MATLILNHRVKDYATWKKLFDLDADRRMEAGITLIAVGQKMGDPGNVYIIFNVEDLGKMQQLMGSAELKKTMEEAGVTSAPEATVIE